jgi:protein-S-isoprenylcysteine O-methyltransferase Ste14
MLLYPALGFVAVFYVAVLLRLGRSPWQVLRERLTFRPPRFDSPLGRRLERWGVSRDILVWGLHVVVVYFFSRTLAGFLRGNTTTMAALAWPGVQARFTSLGDALRTLGAMASQGPTFYSVEILVQVMNLVLFNVTVTGALFGYLYGVVSILWEKEGVRNVDFTVTGWLVNAVSYGPLLGGAIWGMLPPIFGGVPGVADGLVHHAGLWVGLLLNLLYTFSIWNMGTMFGVMVDKGVRRSLMFSVVRHPCYTLEGVMFALLALQQVSEMRAFIPLAANIFLYWMRSERDDDFMGVSNEEYAAYRNEVRHKFLPGLV